MRPSGSTPAVGSSRKRTSGRPTRARARERRCCSPPDSRRQGVRRDRGQPDLVEQGVGVVGVVVVGGEQVEHLGGPEHRVDAALLQHHPDPAHQGGVVAARVEAEDPHRARRPRAGSPRAPRPCWSCRRRSGPSRASTSPRWAVNESRSTAERVAVADDHAVALDGRGAARPRARRRRVCRRGPRVVTLPLCRHDRYPTGPRRHRRGARPHWPAGGSTPPRSTVWPRSTWPPGPRSARATRSGPRSRRCPSRWARPGGPGDAALAERLADESRVAGDRGARAQRRWPRRPRTRCARPCCTSPTCRPRTPPTATGEADNVVARTWPEVAPAYGGAQRVPHWDIGDRAGPARHGAGRQAVRLDVPALPGLRGPAAAGPHARSPSTATPTSSRRSDRRPWCSPPPWSRPGTCRSSRRRPTTSSGTTCGPSRRPRCPSPRCGGATSWRRPTCPCKLTAGTACFRREAGAAGRDTRGLLRVHEFDKVELFAYSTPEQAPDAARVAMVARAEALLQQLGLQYRVLDLCTGDIGNSAARTFDLEVYSPGVDQWLEVSSVSWCTRLPGPPGQHPLPARGRRGARSRRTP